MSDDCFDEIATPDPINDSGRYLPRNGSKPMLGPLRAAAGRGKGVRVGASVRLEERTAGRLTLLLSRVERWAWQATGRFLATLTHANTASRTYTMMDCTGVVAVLPETLTEGSMYVVIGGQLGEIPPGTEGQVLTMVSGLPTWQ